jgi:putative FmdB family regulatory protein
LSRVPTYTYGCDACGKEFEKEQRITDEPLRKCELCGKAKVRRLITGGNFILKGGGWYADGYGSSGSSKSVPKPVDSDSSSSSDSKSSSSSDSKSKKTSSDAA